MKNKEAIEKIIKYLNQQPQEVVNRICANLMIDIHRWIHINQLDQDEKNSLFFRSNKNSNELLNFLKNENNNKSLKFEGIS